MIKKRMEEEKGKKLDAEWLLLMSAAKKMGLSKDSVKQFIQQTSNKKHRI